MNTAAAGLVCDPAIRRDAETPGYRNVAASQRTPSRFDLLGVSLFGLLLVLAFLCNTAPVFGQRGVTARPPNGDVMRGWRVFHNKKCVDCHSIWDQGGRVGPDLGRSRMGRLSEGQLAGVMWNHIPKMLGQMKQTGRPPVTLTNAEMANLFVLIFFVQQLDELGDPVRGEQVLRAKGCSECHTTDSSADGVGPDLAKWGKYANPIIWAQMMWEHAPMMAEAMERSDINWPKLEGADLVHIVAYVRSAGISGEKTYLRPGSATRGQKLFLEKGCRSCHSDGGRQAGSGPDLAVADLPSSVGALASRMWNHSPTMNRLMGEQDVARQPVSPQELADILAFILALGNQDRGGLSARGERVFARKGCVQCHESDAPADVATPSDGDALVEKDIPAASDAPAESDTGIAQQGPFLGRLGQDATPVNMATALWNHGETMLEQMTEAGISWPVFSGSEMVDLLAYLRTVEPASAAGGSPSE